MRIVLLGDSHLDRVRRGLPRLERGADDEVVNAAVGGSVAADVRHQARVVGVGGDDVAVLSVGTNDSLFGEVDVASFESELAGLLDVVRPRRWVYVSPPLTGSAPYAAAGALLVGATGGRVVDTPALLEPLGAQAFDDDGIHLTGAAYDVLLPAIAAAVHDEAAG